MKPPRMLRAAAETEQGNGNDGNGAENGNHDENEVEVEPPVEDEVAGERMMVNDANKPSLVKGTVYPDMKVFRLAVRQFAINEEFELWVKATDRKKYVGACKGASDSPWHVNGRRQADERTVMVLFFLMSLIFSLLCCFLYFALMPCFICFNFAGDKVY
jgi:hypothetical protein